MRRVEKPWGYELIWAETSRYVGKILHIQAGKSLSRQYHERKEETFLVQSGHLRLELGPSDHLERMELSAGASYHCAPRTIHRMIALSDVDVVEVSTPDLDDVVRLEDAYGREGTTAP